MKNGIKLAEKFMLPARAITESIAIMGRKGSGKTYTGGRLFEQMFAVGAQCVALDPVGNWYGLRLSASGKRAGLDIPIFGGEHGDIPITPESGKLIAELLVRRRLSCVIDLKLFRKGQRKKFVTDFAEELFFLKAKNRAPMHIFLEEARKFIPQKPFGPDEMRMIGAFEDIVRLGRNYGLGATLLDQRPQSVNKEVLSQTELLIVHQLTGKHERKEIEAWVREKATTGEDSLSKLDELRPGECFFWSPGLMRTFARIKVGKKKTYDASATPELDDVELVPPRPLSGKDLDQLRGQMATVVEEVEAKDPSKLRAQLRQAQAQVNIHAKTISHLEEKAEHPLVQLERVEVPVFTEKEYRELTARIGEIGKDIGAELGGIQARLGELRDMGRSKAAQNEPKRPESKTFLLNEQHTTHTTKAAARRARAGSNGTRGSKPTIVNPENSRVTQGPDLTGPEQRILDALAWLETIGVDTPEVTAVAFLAGYSANGGAFNNPRGRLRAKKLVDYAPGKRMRLTPTGRATAAAPATPLTTAELHQAVMLRLPGPEGRILQPLLDAWPESMSSLQLAASAGYEAKGGAFNNPRGRLRSLGLIVYPSPGTAVARDFLFFGDS